MEGSHRKGKLEAPKPVPQVFQRERKQELSTAEAPRLQSWERAVRLERSRVRRGA